MTTLSEQHLDKPYNRRSTDRIEGQILNIDDIQTSTLSNPETESTVNVSEDSPLILIVDDNSDMRSLLQSILMNEYRTLQAENGKHALELISSLETPPDLVLSDVMMPFMDGYELTEALRKNPDLEGLPIILLTAKAAQENFLEGFDSGAIDYVVKPFHTGELKSRIKAQLEMKLLRDRLKRSNEMLYEKLKTMIESSDPTTSTEKKAASFSDKDTDKHDQGLLRKLDLVETFIRENYTRDLSREGIAAASGLSPDYMSRKFSEIKGIKMFDFVRDLRLEHAAKQLKECNDTIITITHSSGFDNVRTFNRLFKDKYGKTPAEFRCKF